MNLFRGNNCTVCGILISSKWKTCYKHSNIHKKKGLETRKYGRGNTFHYLKKIDAKENEIDNTNITKF